MTQEFGRSRLVAFDSFSVEGRRCRHVCHSVVICHCRIGLSHYPPVCDQSGCDNPPSGVVFKFLELNSELSYHLASQRCGSASGERVTSVRRKATSAHARARRGPCMLVMARSNVFAISMHRCRAQSAGACNECRPQVSIRPGLQARIRYGICSLCATGRRCSPVARWSNGSEFKSGPHSEHAEAGGCAALIRR